MVDLLWTVPSTSYSDGAGSWSLTPWSNVETLGQGLVACVVGFFFFVFLNIPFDAAKLCEDFDFIVDDSFQFSCKFLLLEAEKSFSELGFLPNYHVE